jgi:hypothetical protein
MLYRQLTDEMNLELEQRRKDFEQRSRQLEDQSRCELRPNGNVCMLFLFVCIYLPILCFSAGKLQNSKSC